MTKSSWGRWGADDQRGAANLIDAAAVRRGGDAVRTGEVLSLALPIDPNHPVAIAGRRPPQHYMTRDGGDYAAGLPERPGFGFADDVVVLPTHGGTHIDALSHVWHDGRMYNGHSSNQVSSRGARVCGIEQVGPLVTRGLLADCVPAGETALPGGHLIQSEELEAAIGATGIEPEPGDALLVRTGWTSARKAASRTPEAGRGCTTTAQPGSCCGFALVGADNIAVDGFPSADPACEAPLHLSLLRAHGVYLCELLALNERAARARPALQLMVAPLPLIGAVGSPVNPVAVL